MDLKVAVIVLLLVHYCPAVEVDKLEENAYEKFCHWTGCQPIKEDSSVLAYCKRKNRTMDGRCCVENGSFSNSTYGMDLSSCSIEELQVDMFKTFIHMDVLMLQNNVFDSWIIGDFVGMTNISELYLPPTRDICPGGNKSWATIEIKDGTAVCLKELNACVGLNLTCPPHSSCQHAGPGAARCLCEPGYYGYKCMRTGKFPMLIYGLSCGIGLGGIGLFLFIVRRFTPKRKHIIRERQRES